MDWGKKVLGGGEGTFLRKGSLPPPKPSPLPPKTFDVIESLFEMLLIIMEEWSLFPQIAYSHSRGGLGEIISPSGCRAEPCPPEAFSFL